jgi:hypothetical protein
MKARTSRNSVLLVTFAIGGFVIFSTSSAAAKTTKGATVVSFYGYDDCLRLENQTTRVTLCPAAGGRVLEYAVNGKNSLYLGWTYAPGRKGGVMHAGRFDIGPELKIPPRDVLWKGRWSGKITGDRSVRLTSAKDPSTGVQLVRDFELDETTTRLTCKQTIKNVSDDTKEYCHWSRTFALGGGICIIPVTEPSRFPNHYVMYRTGSVIDFRPEDPKIRQRDGFLEITGAPQFPKLGMDTRAGWFGYLMPNDWLFVKKFTVDPDRVYNEVAGLTMSIWYPDRPMCELEPIGPRERLEPGQSASFTETWYLLPHAFPKPGESANLKSIARQVAKETER